MISVLNYAFVAVGVMNLLRFDSVKCDSEMLNSVSETEKSYSEFCPFTNSKLPVLIPHAEDCGSFYICNNGTSHLKSCPLGLHFNRNLKVCDYPELAGCDNNNKQVPKSKTIEEESSFCPSGNSKYPVFIPHPVDCSKFYICDSGLAHLRECKLGLHFNPKLKVCDYPLRAQCDAGIRIAFSSVQSPFCPPVNGKTPIFFRDSANCSVYYMCGNGFAYEFACPSKLHFNVRKRVCDFEWNSDCQNINQ